MEEEKITLTLESPAVEEEKEEVKEEEVKVTVDAAKLDDSGLSAEEKKMVEDFSKQIDITQTNAILQYGAAAQNKVADFSENALNKVKSKETGDVGEILSSLVNEFKGFEIKEDEGLKTKYDSAEKNVNKIVDILEEHQVTLLKDISLLDQLYAKNQTNLKELTMYILAGYKALDKYKNEDLPKALEKATKTGASEDAQAANDLSNSINRFEKKLHDLELTRMVSVQMAPQIRLVQNNDTQMVEKIQSTIVNTIPLWKSQMLIALGINHSKEALKAQNEVTEMTNRMLKENAANLKMATIETAKQAERGIVDIETLTDTNKKLIETLEEVQHIQEDGRKKRAEAQVELRKIEAELQRKLTDVVNK